jgi:hypothetical protein
VDPFAEYDLDHLQALLQDDDVERLAAARNPHLDFFIVHVAVVRSLRRT